MARQQMQKEFQAVFKGTKTLFLLLILFSCVINLLMLAPAIYMLQVYDRVLVSQNTTTLLMLTLLVIGFYVLMGFLESIRAHVMIRFGNKLDVSLNPIVFNAAFKKKIATGDNNPAQALTELSQIRQFFSGNSLFSFFDIPWVPVYLLVAYVISPLLGYLTAAGILILLVITLFSERYTNESTRQANTLTAINTNKINQQFQNTDVIAAMGMLPALQSEWIAQQNKILLLQTAVADKTASLSSVSKFTRILLQSIALGAGALLVIAGDITPGLMIAASIILGRALNPVEQVIGSWKQFVQFRAAWQQISILLNKYPGSQKVLELPRPKGVLSVELLYGAAPGGNAPIIKNMSFQLSQGGNTG